MLHSPPMVSYSEEGYAGMTDAYLALWESGRGRDSRRLAWASIGALRRIARLYPIGQPRAWICLGKAQRLDGRLIDARRTLTRAIRSAGRLAMPYEQALARLEFARTLDSNDPGRAEQWQLALETFDRLGAVHPVDQGTEAVVP